MAGEDRVDELTAYLSRLTGQPVNPDEPVRLRSIHRAALSSWARQKKLTIHFPQSSSNSLFNVYQMLRANGAATPEAIETSIANRVPKSRSTGQSILGIGIDIEEVQSVPLAKDYREHPFFTGNFTAAEIAYCLQRPDVRASFCGTWAAKEAIFKSGHSAESSKKLSSIEILRDEHGSPEFSGCHLSISYTTTTAVAVAVCFARPEPVITPSEDPPMSSPFDSQQKMRRMAFGLCGFIAVVFILRLVADL